MFRVEKINHFNSVKKLLDPSVLFHEITMYSLNLNQKKTNMCILVLNVVFIIITYAYVHISVYVVVGML